MYKMSRKVQILRNNDNSWFDSIQEILNDFGLLINKYKHEILASNVNIIQEMRNIWKELRFYCRNKNSYINKKEEFINTTKKLCDELCYLISHNSTCIAMIGAIRDDFGHDDEFFVKKYILIEK